MRRQRGRWVGLVAAAVLVGAMAADSALRLVTTEYEVPSGKLPAAFDGFRIVQLSDLHGVSFGRANARLLERVAAAAPDLIALTGDLADRNTDLSVVDDLLAGLSGIAPVYFVSGNHEWSDRMITPLKALFAAHGVVYLRNSAVSLARSGAHIILCGVEDPNGPADQPAPDAVAAAAHADDPEAYLVLLGHRNDFYEKYPDLDADLVLCGHAHGGIVRLPFLGGVIGHGELFADNLAGIRRSGGYTLVISRGLGNGGVPIPRLLNNPELVVITLRRA